MQQSGRPSHAFPAKYGGEFGSEGSNRTRVRGEALPLVEGTVRKRMRVANFRLVAGMAGALVEKPCLSGHASPTPDTRNADLLRLGDLACSSPLVRSHSAKLVV